MSDLPPEPSPFPHGGPNPQGSGGAQNPQGGQNPQPPQPPQNPQNQNPPEPAPQQPVEKYEQIQFSSRSARVPEKVARGVMATDVLVLWGPNEFMLDFVQALAKPTVVARVVTLPHALEQIVNALKENYKGYTTSYGNPPQMPKAAPNERPRSLQAVYDDLNIGEEMLSGTYANGVMVRHTPAEFHVDFITTLFPQPAVSSRVYIAAPRMTVVIDRLISSLAQYQKAMEQARNQPRPPGPQGTGGV
jgi:hypothetical protein